MREKYNFIFSKKLLIENIENLLLIKHFKDNGGSRDEVQSVVSDYFQRYIWKINK